MDRKLYLPSKLLLHNAMMMTRINRLKTYHLLPIPPPLQYGGPSQTTRFQLKGGICIPEEMLGFMILPPGDLRTGASSPCVGSNSTIIHFPHYLFIITQSNKCAVCSVMLHHTSDKVTRVSASPNAKVTLSSSHFHPLLPREEEYFSSFVSWKYSLTK